MTRETIAIEELSAYVDGELGAVASARVADAAAADPQIAASIAKLQGMKAALGNAFETVQIINVHRSTSPRWHQAGWLVAACLALGMVFGGVWLTAGSPAPGQSTHAGEVLIAMLAAHDKWLGGKETPEQRAIPISSLRHPDLTPAGLSITGYQSPVDLAGMPATRISYIGRRGCRLSLFIMAAAPDLAAAIQKVQPKALVSAWLGADAQYLLVSRRMDQTRFATIAAVLKSSTTKGDRIGVRNRIALGQARQPCRTVG
ncbi:MAG: hypothetical protein ACTSY1_00660 [Alphaproteobacteria bacterium]